MSFHSPTPLYLLLSCFPLLASASLSANERVKECPELPGELSCVSRATLNPVDLVRPQAHTSAYVRLHKFPSMIL